MLRPLTSAVAPCRSQMNVENIKKRHSFSRWAVLKRYVEFHALDADLRRTLAISHPDVLAILPDLPGREMKLLTDHLYPRFIEQRRILLQAYMQRLITIREVVERPDVLDFLGVN